MGATNYVTVSKGKTANEAFSSAHEQAQWEHGHGGYTGTIAEKDSFVEFPRPKGTRKDTVMKIVDAMTTYWDEKKMAKLEKKYPKFAIRQMARVWDDKYGPSACVEVQPNTYVFFGMASQ